MLGIDIIILLIPLISFLCYLFILGILLTSSSNRISKSYTFYVLSMLIWSFGSFMMRTNLPPSVLFWNRVLCVGLILMPVLFYHFTIIYTETSARKNKLYFGYVCAGVLLLLNFLGRIIVSANVENYEIIYELGPAAIITATWSVGYLVLSLLNIILKVKVKEISFNRVKYIILGIVLMIAGGVLNLSSELGKYPLDIVANTLNALFVAFSIYKYKFLEIKLIVRKGLAYSLYTLILTGIYIIAVFALQTLIIEKLNWINGSTFITTLILAVLLALIFHPVKGYIQKWIDKIFYKVTLDNQLLLKNFSKEINNKLNLNELIYSLMNAVKTGLNSKEVYVILLNEKHENQYYFSENSIANLKEFRFSNSHPIIQWFKDTKYILTMPEIDTMPQFTSLWSVEKKLLKSMKTEFIAPITLRENLLGLVLVAEKISEDSYSQEKLDLLFTLLNNAAIVIENAKLYVLAKEQAITDGLTKLYNHRYFHEILEDLVDQHYNDIFSVAILDVDLFKVYNDIYGHSAGDKALVGIANVIKSVCSEKDIIARYGGEEFAIIFPDVNEDESLAVVEKIRKAIESSTATQDNNFEIITISAGITTLHADSHSAEEIIQHADKAMYSAKKNGRNQCVKYSSINLNNNKIENITAYEMEENIRMAHLHSIYALAATIDAKDHYTYGHSENVARYAVMLGKEAGFSKEKISIVKSAGLLHDIGKIGIPEYILSKQSRLTDEEYEIIKKHVDISVTIIKHIPSLTEVIPAILGHHEKFDGTGYPRGLKGENIPIEGICLCIVDAFDAMTTDRPYRKAYTIEEAIAELSKMANKQFDPVLTDKFIQLYKDGKLNSVSMEGKLWRIMKY